MAQGATSAAAAISIGQAIPHFPPSTSLAVCRRLWVTCPAFCCRQVPRPGISLRTAQLLLAQQSTRPDQEDEQEQPEHHHLLIIRADATRGELRGEPGEQASDNAAEVAAEPAGRQRDESAQGERVAQGRQAVRDRSGQYSDDAGQDTGCNERPESEPPDVYPAQDRR